MNMLFSKSKPTVTPEDKAWVEEAFQWFESQYTPEYLRNLRIIEPTREFFDRDFDGSKEDALFVLEKVCEYMEVKDVDIQLYFFSEAPMQFTDEAIMAQVDEDENPALGLYQQTGDNVFEIGIEINQLQDFQGMVSTMAHEVSHLILLGEGRLEENDEPLTDLNCIALGFGIFIGNNIFQFNQWTGVSHGGWRASKRGYIPEQIAAYAMALLQHYQGNTQNWSQYLNKSVKKMYEKNLKYLQTTSDPIDFITSQKPS